MTILENNLLYRSYIIYADIEQQSESDVIIYYQNITTMLCIKVLG